VRVLSFSGFGMNSLRIPLRRYYGRCDLHFVTFSCYRRLPLLGTARARDRFVKILDQVRCSQQFQLIGYVIMPEHVHLLISEPRTADPSKALQVLKQRVSRALRGRRRGIPSQQLSLPFRSFAALPVFWQRRFYDFNVWSAKKLAEKLDYMHRNPLQRKLVTHPRDWPWSSWSHYAGQPGLIGIDVPETNGGSSTRAREQRRKSQPPHPLQTPQRVRHPLLLPFCDG
jgi:putative transposase